MFQRRTGSPHPGAAVIAPYDPAEERRPRTSCCQLVDRNINSFLIAFAFELFAFISCVTGAKAGQENARYILLLTLFGRLILSSLQTKSIYKNRLFKGIMAKHPKSAGEKFTVGLFFISCLIVFVPFIMVLVDCIKNSNLSSDHKSNDLYQGMICTFIWLSEIVTLWLSYYQQATQAKEQLRVISNAPVTSLELTFKY